MHRSHTYKIAVSKYSKSTAGKKGEKKTEKKKKWEGEGSGGGGGGEMDVNHELK